MVIDHKPPEKNQCCQENQSEQPGAPVGFRRDFLIAWFVTWLLSCFHRLALLRLIFENHIRFRGFCRFDYHRLFGFPQFFMPDFESVGSGRNIAYGKISIIIR